MCKWNNIKRHNTINITQLEKNKTIFDYLLVLESLFFLIHTFLQAIINKNYKPSILSHIQESQPFSQNRTSLTFLEDTLCANRLNAVFVLAKINDKYNEKNKIYGIIDESGH